MSKYIVTGITGHIGPHLVNILLDNDHEVYGLHRRTNGGEMEIVDVVKDIDRVRFIFGDLLDFNKLSKIFKEHQFDGCFHLSAQSNPPISVNDPLTTMHTNVIGTANIIQAIAENSPNCKLLFVSTSEVYGNSINPGEKISEEHPLEAANPYSASKLASDVYLQERMRNGIIKGIITRAFSHLAPRRGKNFSISSDAYQIANMMLGKQEKVLKVGNLDSIRVVIDARDVANAYYMLMQNEHAVGHVFNVCGEIPYEMRHYTTLLLKESRLSGVTEQIHPPFWREKDIHYQNGDSSKLMNFTGWSPIIPLEQTMKDVLNYWVKKLR